LVSTRKAAGFSQERLAETVGVERSTVMRWERGETRPQPWARPKLARALGISDQALPELLGEPAEPESAASAPGPIVGEVASLHRRNVLKQKIAPSVLDSPPDSVSDDEGSHELVALLNDLTAHRLPLLDDRYAKGVGVSALEDASLAERAKIILRLFCNSTMSSVVMSCICRCHGTLPALVSASGSIQRMVWLPLGS
jgi:transcriptional regulator with XRE-family HTH domain